jgi:transposase
VKAMSNCDHEEQVMEDDSYLDQDGNEVPDYKWVTRNTWVDIDLHRYRCTRCGVVRYYSERARRFYEDGEGSLP